jgi:hypothetical protein
MASFTGKWKVISSPDFDDEYLHVETEPYIIFHERGSHVEGEYHIGLQRGNIDGRLQAENQIFFSFEGMDEMDEVSGRGTIVVQGNHLTFTLMYYMGDEYTFECEKRY